MNARDLIVNIRGGEPDKCDWCLKPTIPEHLEPEEAGQWVCHECIRDWEEKNHAYWHNGQPGDKLWVRETWRRVEGYIDYRATINKEQHYGDSDAWRPSIFMRRGDSRITLEITGVRVERLQDISEKDAKAEGLARDPAHPGVWTWPGYPSGSTNPIYAYHLLWDSINGKAYPWDSNPWVWVIEFRAA